MTDEQQVAVQPRTAKALDGVISRYAAQVGEEAEDFGRIMIATMFPKGKQAITPTRAHVAALCAVALKYGLDPLIRQVYAFPDKQGGIVPIISIDGWLHIMNSNPNHDGIEFVEIEDEKGNIKACTCTIYRKDRKYPTTVTEHVSECRRPTDPWRDQPRRMIRHRATIQCIRIAYNIAANDPEDGERMADYTVVASQPGGTDAVGRINREIEAGTGPAIGVDMGDPGGDRSVTTVVNTETGEVTEQPLAEGEPTERRKRTRTPKGFALKAQREEFTKMLDAEQVDAGLIGAHLPDEPEPLEEAFAAITKEEAAALLVRCRAGEFKFVKGEAAPAQPEAPAGDPGGTPPAEGQGQLPGTDDGSGSFDL